MQKQKPNFYRASEKRKQIIEVLKKFEWVRMKGDVDRYRLPYTNGGMYLQIGQTLLSIYTTNLQGKLSCSNAVQIKGLDMKDFIDHILKVTNHHKIYLL